MSTVTVKPLSHLEQARLSVKCSFCTRIIKQFYIQCATCSNVFLCADCFSAKVTMPPHDSSHPYFVARCLERSIFEKDWTAKEELMLFDGIQKYGAGNWKEISTFMDSDKKEKRIEEHYWQLYMGKHGVCLPVDYSIDNLSSFKETVELFPNEPTVQDSSNVEQIASTDYFRVPLVASYERGQAVERDVLPSHVMPVASIAPASTGGRGRQSQQASQAALSHQALIQSDLPGYMPLREDFETEYENDAEQFLADMEFSPEDHPSEVELKLQVIRIYNHKLEEREKRKRFVLERGLVDIKKHQQEEKKLSKEERDLVAKLRPFARYQSQEEYDALVKGILQAHRLSQKIEMYKIYRKMGFSTLDDVIKYEADKKQKEHEQRYRKERDSASYLYEKSHLQTGVSALGKRTSSIESLEEVGGSSSSGRGRAGRRKAAATMSVTLEDADLSQTASATLSRVSSTMAVDDFNHQSSSNDKEASSRASWSALPPLVSVEDVRQATGGHMLADLEVQLCARIPMQPLLYLGVKEAIVREAYQSRLLTEAGIKRQVGEGLSDEHVDALFDFFVKEAHINQTLARHQLAINHASNNNCFST
jgi:transcriptional adapter 2-alpha